MIKFISEQINSITTTINALVEENSMLKARKKVLKTVPGIGDNIANDLLVLLPELGSLNRR